MATRCCDSQRDAITCYPEGLIKDGEPVPVEREYDKSALECIRVAVELANYPGCSLFLLDPSGNALEFNIFFDQG